MNKKKYKRIVLSVLLIFIFCIAFFETQLYYKDTISNPLYLLFLSIMNGVRIFALRSTMDIFDIVQAEIENITLARRVLDNFYILCYFCAPLITVKYVTKFVNYLAKGRLSISALSRKERVLIVGYHAHVEHLAKDIIHSNKRSNKKRKLVILYKDEIPESKKNALQMSGVLFKEYSKLDYEKCEEREEILKWLCPKKIKHIILFEEKDMDNFSNYCFFLKCFEAEDYSGFIDDIKMDCNYNLSQVEQLIWNCFDKKKVGLKYSMNTFSLPMLRAQSVLEKYQVYENMLDTQGEAKDIHLLIIGFGRMGRRFFKRAINQSVISQKNHIVVDIVEKDSEKTKWYLERLCKEYYNLKDNTVHIGSEVVEGDLQIRLHGFDINDIRFADCLERISEENPFTYIAICIDNPEESVNCMLHIEEYLQKREQSVPVLMRMDSGQQIKELESIYNNLHLVPGDDEILTMENIRSEYLETVSVNIHKKDDASQRDKTQYAYQVESRKYRLLHYDAKREVVERMTEADREHALEVFQSSGYTEKKQRNEFLRKIKEDKILQKLGVIEHRRWSYYMILNGWTYGEVKDEDRKETPYLCPFAKILDSSELQSSAYYEYKDWEEIITK